MSVDDYIAAKVQLWRADRLNHAKAHRLDIAPSPKLSNFLADPLAGLLNQKKSLRKRLDSVAVFAERSGLELRIPSHRVDSDIEPYGFATRDGTEVAIVHGFLLAVGWAKTQSEAQSINLSCCPPRKSLTSGVSVRL